MGRASRAHRLLEDRIRFETLLSDLSARLIHIDAGGLDAALESGLRQMVGFLGMDRGNLDEYIDGRPGVRLSWAEPGIATLPSRAMRASGHAPTCRYRYRLEARCSACCPLTPFARSAIGRTSWSSGFVC